MAGGVTATRCVLLLRGVNVGGRHSLPMAELRSLLTDACGCRDVRTYIQSGNAVCTAPAGFTAPALAATLAQRFGFPVPVVLRSAEAWRTLVAANPFAARGDDPAHLHAVFFDVPPAPASLAALEAVRAGGEECMLHGRELYLLLPHGVGRSKLALALASPKLPGAPTMRNWRTVLSLAAML